MRICIKPSLLGSRTKMLNFMQCICAWHISIFSHRLPFPSSVDSHYKSIGNNMILIHDCIWFFFNQYINQFELILSVILTNKMILKQRARSNGFSKTFFLQNSSRPNQQQNSSIIEMCFLLGNHPMLDICILHQQERVCIYFAGHLFINYPIFCWTQRYVFVLQNQCLCKYGGPVFVMLPIINLWFRDMLYRSRCGPEHIVSHNQFFRFLQILVTTHLLHNTIKLYFEY